MKDIDQNTTLIKCGLIDMDNLKNQLVFRCDACPMETCIVDEFENHIRDGHDNLRTDQTTAEENEDDPMEYEILEIEPASPSHFADVGGDSSSDVEKLSSEELAASEREEDENGELDDDKYIYKKIPHGLDSKGQLYTNIEWLLPVKHVVKTTPIPYNPQRSYRCHECHRGYKSAYMLSKHLNTHPNGNQSTTKVHQCELCSSTFGKYEGLLEHMKLHFGEKPYVCKKCWKFYTHAAGLSAHMKRVHQKDGKK